MIGRKEIIRWSVAGGNQRDFIKKSKNFGDNIFVILSIHKPSLSSCQFQHKIWARSVQPFWRLLDTNKQTNTQTSIFSFSLWHWYCKTKQKQKVCGCFITISWIFWIYGNWILFYANFRNFDHSHTFLGAMWGPTQNLYPIAWAVLTFIGYKRTDKQTNRQAKYIYTD